MGTLIELINKPALELTVADKAMLHIYGLCFVAILFIVVVLVWWIIDKFFK